MQIPPEAIPIRPAIGDNADDRAAADRSRPNPIDAIAAPRASTEQLKSNEEAPGREVVEQPYRRRAEDRAWKAGERIDERRVGERRHQKLPVLLDTRIKRSRRQNSPGTAINTEA